MLPFAGLLVCGRAVLCGGRRLVGRFVGSIEFAEVDDGDAHAGTLLTSAASARAARAVSVRFHDDRVRARIEEDDQ